MSAEEAQSPEPGVGKLVPCEAWRIAQRQCIAELDQTANWAWAAGFMDGEGTFLISRERDSRKGTGYRSCRAMMAVSNTCKYSLMRLTNIFGIPDKIIVRPQLRPHHKQQWQFNIRSQVEIVRIIRCLLPYLIVKRCVAELLMTFCEMRIIRGREGRGRYHKHTETELFLVDCIRQQNNRRKPIPWRDYERGHAPQ
jgi:LAGLIDADG endonuclease